MRTVPRKSVAKWPDSGATSEHARLRGIDVLLEMQECSERGRQRGVLVHRDLAIADRDAVDPEGRARVRKPGPGNKFVGGGQVAQDCVVGDARQGLTERAQRGGSPRADRHHDVGMDLIGLVEHSPTLARRRGQQASSASQKASAFYAAVRDNFADGRANADRDVGARSRADRSQLAG